MPITMLATVNTLRLRMGSPVANMWWTHSPKLITLIVDQRNDQQRVSHRCPARECGKDLAHHPQCGNKDDIHFRVSEEPEQVLPEQRVASQVRVEEVGVEQPGPASAGWCAMTTDGMAKMTMKEVTSMAHTNTGIRFSDMPGARNLKMVTINSVAAISEEISVPVTRAE